MVASRHAEFPLVEVLVDGRQRCRGFCALAQIIELTAFQIFRKGVVPGGKRGNAN